MPFLPTNYREDPFKHVEEFRARRKFIDYALEENRAGRHYSAVPLLLMIIDGAMSDATGKGFHASDITLDVWDSLMNADGAIYKIKEIFQKGRRKTRTEPINMPYRNGILHGMDLGYDNPIVTAKCWCFLFVVRDWLVSKKSEADRKKVLEEETRVPSLREITAQLAQTSRMREAIDAWEPRNISPEYVDSINSSSTAVNDSPESLVLECLALWKARNYGDIAKLYYSRTIMNPGTHVREVRQQLAQIGVNRYTIRQITDVAPVIGEIDVEIAGGEDDSNISHWTYRLIREGENGDSVPDNLPGGCWRIVWIRLNWDRTGRPT